MSCVTARDCRAIRLVYEFHFLTIDQAKTCIYRNRNVAQRRMSLLEKDGWFLSIPVSIGLPGQPTKAYYINWRKRKPIGAMLGEELFSRNMLRTPPHNTLVTAHQLELNTVLTAFMAASSLRGHFFRCIPEYCVMATPRGPVHPLTCKIRDPSNRSRMVGVRRDAVLCIGVGRNKALFELEYDRGKEAVTSEGIRAVTLSRKIGIFMQGLKEQAFQRYCSPQFFDHPFRTSRLLIVTSTEERRDNLASICHEQKTDGMVYLTTIDRVKPESVFDPIWIVPANGQNPNRALVGGS